MCARKIPSTRESEATPEATLQASLPPEFERVAALAKQRPPEVQEVLQFVSAVAMEESGVAELINTSQVDGRTWTSYESAAGDVFLVARPEIDAELEKERQALEGILMEESLG